jgi:hypothetical protein
VYRTENTAKGSAPKTKVAAEVLVSGIHTWYYYSLLATGHASTCMYTVIVPTFLLLYAYRNGIRRWQAVISHKGSHYHSMRCTCSCKYKRREKTVLYHAKSSNEWMRASSPPLSGS